MTAQTIVAPEKIESTLIEMWSALAKQNKTRACLFNLIVYAEQSARSDVFREVIYKVIENYPCRIIFLSKDPQKGSSYIKTAVSVIDSKEGSDTACDSIDVGFSLSKEEEVFFLILPHIVTDLPIHLLWLDAPSFDHPLFAKLEPLVDRVIFDAGSSPDLYSFLQDIFAYLPKRSSDLSDLNWTRIAPWQRLVQGEFRTEEEKVHLANSNTVCISYNAEKSAYIPHPASEAIYFAFWLASLMKWTIQKREKNAFVFLQGTIQIEEKREKTQRPGSILDVEMKGEKTHFSFSRNRESGGEIRIQVTLPNQCFLPKTMTLKKGSRGASLSKEMLKKQTDHEYLHMIESMQKLLGQ